MEAAEFNGTGLSPHNEAKGLQWGREGVIALHRAGYCAESSQTRA